MPSVDLKKLYSLRADASALGGYLETPVAKLISTLAPVSLPPVGGFAMARSEAFTLDQIVSCSSAYTRVTGQECCEDGSCAILVTAVIEDLNILEVVRADRIVTQLSIAIPADDGAIGMSFAGTAFEALRIAGHACRPTMNEQLQRPRDSQEAGRRLTWEDIRQPASGARYAQASLVERLEVAGGCRSDGHVVEIPEFGRIMFGELRVAADTVQLVGIRAELCCPVPGKITACAVGGGGTHDN
jgi:hypothetical protein